MHSPPKRAGKTASVIAVAAAGGLIGLYGCSDDATQNSNTDMATNTDMGMAIPGVPPTKSASVATIDRPLAAVVTSDGKTVYFTAHNAQRVAALYSVPVAGGTPTAINTSKPLYHPLGLAISPDDRTLYIADSIGGSEDAGAVYTSDTSGNLSATSYDGVRGPAGVAVSADGSKVYITGFDKTDGQPGLFTAGSTAGNANVVAKGAPFRSPSAVTTMSDGSVYVVDATSQGTTRGVVIKVTGSTAAVLSKQPMAVGFSAGIAPVGPGSSELLITGHAGLGAGAVYKVTAAGDATALALGAAYFDPATIARAGNANVWIVVDSVIGTQAVAGQQQGQLFQLTP